MNNPVRIHFVCRGNIYRSRLAMAYMSSFQHPNWNISSSGIQADRHKTVQIGPWAVMIAKKNHIDQWLGGSNHKTTRQDLEDSDIIVFLSRDVYRDAKELYTFNEDKALVWSVKDREDWPADLGPEQKRRGTFMQIKRRVNQLVKDMTAAGNWVDIVDENNQKRGFTLPVVIANKKKLWHRGCHAVIRTSDGKTIIQQRSKSIVFAPGMIDITLGGHVDAGETPKHAVLREIREEMGLHVDPDDLRPLEVFKRSAYHPKYKTHTRSFVYAFAVTLDEANPFIKIQSNEVEQVRLLGPRQLNRLIKMRRISGVGRLNYGYAFYRRIVDL